MDSIYVDRTVKLVQIRNPLVLTQFKEKCLLKGTNRQHGVQMSQNIQN